MVPKMIGEAEAYFRAWGDEGNVELRHVFSELVLRTATSCLMGREIRESLSSEIARLYQSLDGGLTPLSTLWPSAPTAAHRVRDAARREMVGIVSKAIARRCSGEVIEDDFLQQLLDFRYAANAEQEAGGPKGQAGRGLTDSEVTGLLIVLLFAGQHTSSITATWLGAMLLAHPEAMAELRAEQERLVPNEPSLGYKALLEMDSMRRAITETLRLYPPLVLLMRKVMVPTTVGNFRIPKGDVVGLCAPASNMDPRYWHDAEQFQPSRFAEDGPDKDSFDSRSVGHGMLQGMMLSLGGGAHMCAGRRFGYLQVCTIWSILLREFEMEMVSPLPLPNYNDMVVGPDGPITVKYRRKLSTVGSTAKTLRGAA